MVPFEYPESVVAMIPNHYMGRWRIIFNVTFTKNGNEMYECRMGFGDVFVE